MELLVATGIIVILAALLLTGINRMKSAAAGVTGTHNAGTIVKGALNYANDHRGVLPSTDWGSFPDASSYTRWVEEVAPYVYGEGKFSPNGGLMVDGVFRNRGMGGFRRYGNAWREWSWDGIDWINFHQVQAADGQWNRLSTLKEQQSRQPFVVSSDRNTGSSGLYVGEPGVFTALVPPEVWVFNKGVIVGYCDGHVENIKEPTLEKVIKRQGQ